MDEYLKKVLSDEVKSYFKNCINDNEEAQTFVNIAVHFFRVGVKAEHDKSVFPVS